MGVPRRLPWLVRVAVTVAVRSDTGEPAVVATPGPAITAATPDPLTVSLGAVTLAAAAVAAQGLDPATPSERSETGVPWSLPARR
jgi:hypothetical protein